MTGIYFTMYLVSHHIWVLLTVMVHHSLLMSLGGFDVGCFPYVLKVLMLLLVEYPRRIYMNRSVYI
jgi:hypothetical protein